MNIKLILHQESEGLTDQQSDAIGGVLVALQEFLVAPNETATELNNNYNRLAGQARKLFVKEANKEKKTKKETK